MDDNMTESESVQAERKDVEFLYLLALGRAFDEPAMKDFVGRPLPFLLGVFFESPEFGDKVLSGLERRLPPAGGAFSDDVPATLKVWLVERAPLSDAGRQAVAQAETWSGLYLALFSDPAFQQAVGVGPSRPFSPVAWEALSYWGAVRRGGEIEDVRGAIVSGWAADRATPTQPLNVELWIDGERVAAASADIFRRELQDRFGGEGAFGFRIDAGDRLADGEHHVEIRDRETGMRLAEVRHHAAPRSAQPYEALVEELRSLREALTRLERTVPPTVSRLGFPLEEYGRYAETYGRIGDAALLPQDWRPAFCVVLRAAGADAQAVEDAVTAVMAQTWTDWRLAVVGLDHDGRQHLQSLLTRLEWRGETATKRVSVHDDVGTALEDEALWLNLPAHGVLAPEALAVFAGALADAGVAAAYADEDHLDVDGDFGRARRRDPLLKPTLDLDLLCQTPYVGDCVAFRSSAWRPTPGARAAGALLRLAVAGRRIGHAPSILFSRSAGTGEPDDWATDVGAALGADAALEVAPHADVLGARVPGAIRLKRIPRAKTATVIIPTKNGLDLLRPCVDSILGSARHNRVALDLLIIDHESDDPETRLYLDDLTARGEARVMPYRGAFNWALMNNMAVEQARGEVLVFLNNDTVVISPDWLDELAGQAERPDVGAVGARLLYGDDTIQHGGFVARDRRENFLIHDGVGAQGSEAGYMGRYALLRQTVAVTGACIALAAETFKRLGGFDAAHFPVEGNDVDLCMRAQAEGLKVLYDPYATLYHLESKTRGFSRTGEKLEVAEASGRMLWARWGERFHRDPFYNPRFDREAPPFARLRPLP